MPTLKEQTLARSYSLIDALRREGRADDAATVEALLATAQAQETTYLTINEAAQRLGVSRQTIVKLINRGILPSARLAGRLMVPASAFARFAEIESVLDQLDAEGSVLSPEDAARIIAQRRSTRTRVGADVARSD